MSYSLLLSKAIFAVVANYELFLNSWFQNPVEVPSLNPLFMSGSFLVQQSLFYSLAFFVTVEKINGWLLLLLLLSVVVVVVVEVVPYIVLFASEISKIFVNLYVRLTVSIISF